MTHLLLAQVIMSLSVYSWEADKACGVLEKTFFRSIFISALLLGHLWHESQKKEDILLGKKTQHNTALQQVNKINQENQLQCVKQHQK